MIGQTISHYRIVEKLGGETHETVEGKDSQGKPFEELRVLDKQ